MKPRKGSKANPFQLGERVRDRMTYEEGEVVEIGGVFTSPREFEGKYLVWFDRRIKRWKHSTQLETVRD